MVRPCIHMILHHNVVTARDLFQRFLARRHLRSGWVTFNPSTPVRVLAQFHSISFRENSGLLFDVSGLSVSADRDNGDLRSLFRSRPQRCLYFHFHSTSCCRFSEI